MEITEVRVKLMDDPDDRLQAFCSVTFDNSFAVRDLKNHRRNQWSVRGDAKPKADNTLHAMQL